MISFDYGLSITINLLQYDDELVTSKTMHFNRAHAVPRASPAACQPGHWDLRTSAQLIIDSDMKCRSWSSSLLLLSRSMWWRIITIRITAQAASRRSQLGSAFNFSSSMVHEKKYSNVRNVDWMQVKIAQRLAGSWKVYFRHSASAQFGYVVKKKRPLFGGDRRTLDTLHPWTLDMYILIELESKPDFTVVMMMMREEVQWKKQEVRANTRQE